MEAVTIPDSLKSVRNRCVMDVFGGVFVSHDVCLYSYCSGAFVLGLSYISFNFS